MVICTNLESWKNTVCGRVWTLFTVLYLYCGIPCDAEASADLAVHLCSTVYSCQVHSWLPLWRTDIKREKESHSQNKVLSIANHTVYRHWMCSWVVLVPCVTMSTTLVHKTFVELHSKIELQPFPKQLK